MCHIPTATTVAQKTKSLERRGKEFKEKICVLCAQREKANKQTFNILANPEYTMRRRKKYVSYAYACYI